MSELTLSQQFELAKFNELAKTLNRDQAIEALCELYKSNMAQKVTYNELLKQAWGIQ